MLIVYIHFRKINFRSCHRLQNYFYNENSRFTVDCGLNVAITRGGGVNSTDIILCSLLLCCIVYIVIGDLAVSISSYHR